MDYGLQKKRGGKIAAVILVILLLCALGFGAGVLLRELGQVRIVPAEGASRSGTVYVRPESSGGGAAAALLNGDEGLSASEIYALMTPACVGVTTSTTTRNIFGQTTEAAISGSGFLISADGYILTNYHVIETALENGLDVTVMLYSGEEQTAAIIGGDAKNDVALLKIPGSDRPCVTLGVFSDTLVGEAVYTIGNPLGELSYSMTAGIVSALERNVTVSGNVSIDMFQIDAAINSGNSGGPVVNRFGQVIGIVSAKYSSSGVEGLGFAIPIDDALRVVDDLISYGRVRFRPLLGVTVSDAARYGYETGSYVVEVTPGGSADRAGILPGDVIVEAGGVPIGSNSDLLGAKKAWAPGDTVGFAVERAGERLRFDLTLDEDMS